MLVVGNNKLEMNMSDKDTEAPERATTQSVVVKKEDLTNTLKLNRDNHRQAFEEAVAGYRKRAIELLEEHIKRISDGKVERVLVSLPEPEDHTDDYNRIITMLEWTVFDTVELPMREFDMYVRDNWNWKGEFIATSQMYTKH